MTISLAKMEKQFKFVNKVPEASRRGRRRLYEGIAAKLKARPGKWAQIAVFDDSLEGTYLRNTLYTGYGLNVRLVRLDNGKAVLYAQYPARSRSKSTAPRKKAASKARPTKKRR